MKKGLYIFFTIWLIAVIASPFYFEYPNYWISKVVTFDDNGIATERPFGAFAWEFADNFSNIPTVENSTSFISPRTKNRYTVNTVIYDPDAFFKTKERRHSFATFPWINATVMKEIDMTVSYYLLEFDAAFGQPISLANPTNKKGWLALETLIEVYMNANLAQYGIMVTTVDLQ